MYLFTHCSLWSPIGRGEREELWEKANFSVCLSALRNEIQAVCGNLPIWLNAAWWFPAGSICGLGRVACCSPHQGRQGSTASMALQKRILSSKCLSVDSHLCREVPPRDWAVLGRTLYCATGRTLARCLRAGPTSSWLCGCVILVKLFPWASVSMFVKCTGSYKIPLQVH